MEGRSAPPRSTLLTASTSDHLDVVIVGAGLSGIGAAVHLQTALPDASYALLEAREASGGTWDLFRYPGVRSGLRHAHARLPVPAVAGRQGDRRRRRRSSSTSATPPRDHGVEQHIRYRSRLVSAEWSSPDARWTLHRRGPGDRRRRPTLTCGFLLVCAGYYRYDEGYTPDFPGVDVVRGAPGAPAALARGPRPRRQARRRHRQRRDRRHARPGAGRDGRARDDAAAHADVHRLAAVASTASPTRCARALPARPAYRVVARRRTSCCRGSTTGSASAGPRVMKALGAQGARRRSCRPATTSRPHFTPPYDPWDQRFCLVPGRRPVPGDPVRHGRGRHRGDRDVHADAACASTTGEELAADVVVTATGLQLQALGGVRLVVDGARGRPGRARSPTRARCSAACRTSRRCSATRTPPGRCAPTSSATGSAGCCERMRASGADTVVAEWSGALPDRPFLDLTSGYVQRSLGVAAAAGRDGAVALHPGLPAATGGSWAAGPRAFEGLTFSRADRRVAADA